MSKRILSILCCTMLLLGSAIGLAETTTVTSLKDDFYEAVNAEWYATAEIPADMPTAGGFDDLSDGVEEVLMADFQLMLAGEKEPGSALLQNFVEFLRLASDFEARDAAGAAPLQPYMQMIDDLESLQAFSDQWAEFNLTGLPAPFATGVMADMGNADMNALYITPPSLLLLDKSYYADEATKGMLQGLYGQMAVNLFVLAGTPQEEAEAIVAQALAFDESLAPFVRSAAESADYTAMYNPADFAEFDAQIAGFDFTASFAELLGEVPETIIVTEPDYFAALDTVVHEDTFEALKSWMKVVTITSIAPYLTSEMRVESGSFTRALSGVSEATSPEKSAYYLAAGMFGEVVGVYYGQTYFGEQARQDVADMVQAILETYEVRLQNNTWLSDDTRTMAIKKLASMSINVGYPDEARPLYSLFETVAAEDGGTLLGNAMAFSRISTEDNYADWNTPVERGLWPLSADTVNAMYSPMDNSINFPAAILQAPFYSLEQHSSANYGGIGAVIAHEISHAFDPNGAKFDERGSLNEWWTEQDYATFTLLSQAMIDEFDGIEYAGGAVDGTMTMAENVADAGGLSCAVEAAKQEDDVDLEALFTNWAVIWRQKATPEFEAMLLIMDVHAPSKLRANIQLQNMDDFYTVFDIQEGDGMYRAPEDRVGIW